MEQPWRCMDERDLWQVINTPGVANSLKLHGTQQHLLLRSRWNRRPATHIVYPKWVRASLSDAVESRSLMMLQSRDDPQATHCFSRWTQVQMPIECLYSDALQLNSFMALTTTSE
ncbi:hypothetical protein TcWFU_004833 [Taenia crassiceps]|uniref:Uncharacterized protein n=1 Tax=Taenia crassiceps TaxID=6207 RepID=A0ABR4Q7W3_9CEST